MSSDGVEEDILIGSASAPTSYGFSTPGTSLGTSGTALGGKSTGLPPSWVFMPPSVTDRMGRYQNGAGQALRASSTGATVNVDPSWLASQPSSAFPIDVDPSIQSPPMPPWLWNGTNDAVFCEDSTGYTGHPSGGPYTTCTLNNGNVGAKVGWDGTNDWETELAFNVPTYNPDPEIPANTPWEPSGCTPSAVGTASQSLYCTGIVWAQIGLALPSHAIYDGSGTVEAFRGKLDGVACPSATHCIAVGYGRQAIVLVTADGGTKWVVSQAPQDVHQLTAVSCATATECLAVGSSPTAGVVIATKNGGLSWTTVPFPLGAAGQVVASSCFTAYECALVVQNKIIVTTNGGRTWEPYALPSHLYPAAIACTGASSCVSVGGHEIASTHTGWKSWKFTELASRTVSSLYGVFCRSAEDCVPVGGGSGAGSVLVSTDGGASWRSPRVS